MSTLQIQLMTTFNAIRNLLLLTAAENATALLDISSSFNSCLSLPRHSITYTSKSSNVCLSTQPVSHSPFNFLFLWSSISALEIIFFNRETLLALPFRNQEMNATMPTIITVKWTPAHSVKHVWNSYNITDLCCT